MRSRCNELHLFFSVLLKGAYHPSGKKPEKDEKYADCREVGQQKQDPLPDDLLIHGSQRMKDGYAKDAARPWQQGGRGVVQFSVFVPDGKLCLLP